jgi:hypothetical protein
MMGDMNFAPNNVKPHLDDRADEQGGASSKQISSGDWVPNSENDGNPANGRTTGEAPIRYVIEYVDAFGVVRDIESASQPIKPVPRSSATVLEVITTVAVRPSQARTAPSSPSDLVRRVVHGTDLPPRRVRIISSKLVNALRAVVDYYPGQILVGDNIEVDEPFRFLLHHRQKLAQYKSEHPPTHGEEYKSECNLHIDCLLKFLEDTMGKSIREEEQRHRRGFATFENLWLLFKPGERMFARCPGDRIMTFLLDDIRGGVVSGEAKKYTLSLWNIRFNGNRFNKVDDKWSIPPFDGEKEITSLRVYPQSYHHDTAEELQQHENRTLQEQMVLWGERYFGLASRCLKEYYGWTVDRGKHPRVSRTGHLIVQLSNSSVRSKEKLW